MPAIDLAFDNPAIDSVGWGEAVNAFFDKIKIAVPLAESNATAAAAALVTAEAAARDSAIADATDSLTLKVYVDAGDADVAAASHVALLAEGAARSAEDALKADRTYVDIQDAGLTAALAAEAAARIAGDAAASEPPAQLGNVVLVPQPTGTNLYASNGGFTTFIRLMSRVRVLNPKTWTFSHVSATGIGIVGCVVYRTLKDSLVVIDSTVVTFGGLSTGIMLGVGESFCDPIALALDLDHDYYIATYFDGAAAGAGAATVANFLSAINIPVVGGGFLNSNQIGIAPGIAIPVGAFGANECVLSQALALS